MEKLEQIGEQVITYEDHRHGFIGNGSMTTFGAELELSVIIFQLFFAELHS